MASVPITIHVDADAARAFREASPEDRRKLEALLSLQLLEATKPPPPLRDLMREISERARGRGLTPERLRDLLEGDEGDDAARP